MLARFTDLPLLNRYNVYQRLMNYWAEVMQDDVYLIAGDGWVDAARVRGIIEDKDKKIKETPDLTIKRRKYKMDLVPPALVVARYFAKERAAVKALYAKQEAAARELEEFVEEHTGEEELLEEAANDKGNVTKGGVKDRLKTIEGESENGEERDALTRCLALIEAESDAGRAVSEAQAALDEKVLVRYAKLTEAEIKQLVVDDKWFAAVATAISDEIDKKSQMLVSRIKELEGRYAHSLPSLHESIAAAATVIESHARDFSTQQLITGQTRLPGFHDEWQPRKLRDLLRYERPDKYIVRSTDYVDHGDIPVLTANKSFVLGYTIEDFGICADLPAIIFDDFTTDLKYVDFPFKVKSSAMKILRVRHDKVSLRFMFGRMQLIRHPVGDHKRYYLSEYQNIEIHVPGYEEQEAIASVLAQADAQVRTLQRLQDKTGWTKRGIAQALLYRQQPSERSEE